VLNIRFTTILFDIDGTLIDSNKAHASAWVDTLAEFGFTVPFDTVRPLVGMGGDKLLPAVTGIESGSVPGRTIAARRADIFRERYLPMLQPTRGAGDLVRALDEGGFTVGVATSAQGNEVRALLEVATLAGRFDGGGSSDDAERSKPDPDIVQAALRHLHAHPQDSVLVGDTPYDIEAANRAGVAAVALRCGGWWKDSDFDGAVLIADDPAELLARWSTG
jgi:beta-phosphoglucomutase-like phosphatase (HAD superfamily)